jgi:MYXO-CTERM domain-containing protein
MTRVGALGIAFVCSSAIAGLAPATAVAGTVCGTVEDFNAAMAAGGAPSTDVTLTFDVVGVHPGDFFNDKGSLAQMRNTTCASGQDAGIKVYGTSEPLNEAHPPGTLKLEYGNSCCGGDCGEQWADPNASAVIFVDGSEQCTVTMWINPTEVGYSLACNVGTFDALGENPEGNIVDRIALLEYILADGGTTWELPNATASNDEVCWVETLSMEDSLTVPVVEDVTTGPAWPNSVFPDVNDLAVEADGTQAYLKFEVPPIEGKVTSVRLLMHSSTAPSSDGDGGEVHAVTDDGWSESTMTWDTRPAYEAPSFGRIGPAAADVPVSLDLGAAAIDWPGGTYSFAVFSPPTDGNGTHFFSKEGSPANAASLSIHYVVVDGDGDGAPDGPDCDDADAAIGPDANELCGNGVDDDCDGETDEGCPGGVDESGGGTAADGGTSDGSASGGEDGFLTGPGLGERPGATGCACTTSRHPDRAWLGMLVLALGLVRRRRS